MINSTPEPPDQFSMNRHRSHRAGRNLLVFSVCSGALILPGCGLWRANSAADAQATEAYGVLNELGLGARVADAPDRTRSPEQPEARGPSLVAGDAIAWRWALAYDIAPHPGSSLRVRTATAPQ